MAAYLIGHITVKDAAAWQEYARSVPATLAPFGAELLFRGDGAETLTGSHDFTDVVAIRFPDLSAIRRWHESAAYRALIPVRERAADVVIIGYTGS
ncbi:MAG: DUF1330 domain-containing protein [Bryobacteraceae bacterium]